MRVKANSKVIPTSFLKIEGRGTFVGARRREEMSGDERLPEERWRRVGMSGSLRELTQSITFSPRGVESTL